VLRENKSHPVSSCPEESAGESHHYECIQDVTSRIDLPPWNRAGRELAVGLLDHDTTRRDSISCLLGHRKVSNSSTRGYVYPETAPSGIKYYVPENQTESADSSCLDQCEDPCLKCGWIRVPCL